MEPSSEDVRGSNDCISLGSLIGKVDLVPIKQQPLGRSLRSAVELACMCSVRWPKNEEMINEAVYHLPTTDY